MGINLPTDDKYFHAAFSSLRHLLSQHADVFTDVECPCWCDRIDELRERDAAVLRRHASGKKGDRSNSEGDRSNFEGDRGKKRRRRC